MKIVIVLLSLVSIFGFSQNSTASKEVQESQKAIIKEFLNDCAQKYDYGILMNERQKCLDAGLAKDSTIAYLWQQKAMPLFKMRKYEAGMVFLDKAVLYDEKSWLDYRAFIKCIFVKSYKDAIVDFEKCKTILGNSYVMDHSYDFHIALSYLQLNEFEKAETIFKKDTEDQKNRLGEAHHLDLFYYGISLYEQNKYIESIQVFNRALKQFPDFSDVKFYKAIAMIRAGQPRELADILIDEAKKDLENGNTINEDQIFYEMYPYQIRKLIN